MTQTRKMTKLPFIFSILGQNFINSARDFYSTFGFHFLWHATTYEIQQSRLTSIFGDFGLWTLDFGLTRLRIKWHAPECAGTQYMHRTEDYLTLLTQLGQKRQMKEMQLNSFIFR